MAATNNGQILALIKFGHRADTDHTWTEWWLFSRLDESQLDDALDFHGIEAHSCSPGGIFRRRPTVRHTATLTLIQQQGGWDV